MRLTLNPGEAEIIEQLATAAVAHGGAGDGYRNGDSERLRDVALRAHQLPLRLQRFLDDMKRTEPSPVCVISGITVDDSAIGPTPPHWGACGAQPRAAREEAILLLCGSLLGDAFGWATQQNGTVVHDILPIRGQEHDQLGSGSEAELMWHTEEAFHPLRCDYLGLMCLRNPDGVATTVAGVGGLALRAEHLDTLLQPRYVIRPDTSHLGQGHGPATSSAREARLLAAAQDRARRMNEAPEPVAVLYGTRESPYLCVDPSYMGALPGDAPARAALDALVHEIEAGLREVVLEPGDVCFIDNFRAVHGRTAFKPRYDGADRWLKRVNLTRDLRRSRMYRMSSDSRVVY